MKLVIGFSRPRSNLFPIFSWVIRAFEGTPYSHVYVRWYSSGAEVEIAYEASGTSVKFLGKEVFDKKILPICEYEVEINSDTYKKLLKFCMTNAGMSYGTKQILGIALVKIFKMSKNPFSDGRKSQVCSELVGNILQDVLGEDLNLDLDIAGPRSIQEFLDKKAEFSKIL